MAQRLVALLAGNKEGPWMHTAHFKKPRLVIKGLENGTVTLTTFIANDSIGSYKHIEFSEEGEFPVDAAQKMQLSYSGTSPGLQCLIMAK